MVQIFVACCGGVPQDTALIDLNDIFGNVIVAVSAQHNGQMSLQDLALSFLLKNV